MVDVRLLYPTEKVEAAARLAEALEASGYTVKREALADSPAFPSLAANAADAGVLLLIWSRGLVTAAMDGGLAEARRHPNLIEVSVDGIEPGVAGETSPVVLLSGWRGQPFHLGWQRILADVKRLSGARDLPKRSGSAASGEAGGRGPGGAARRSAPRLTRARAAVAAGALLAATLGTAAALDWSGPVATPDAGVRPATAPGNPPRTAGAPAPLAAAVPVPVQASLPDPPSEAVPAPSASARSAPIPEPAAATAEPRAKVAAQRSGPKRTALAPEPKVKRYSRKYSKTMRLFCQRSGRSTPQCRTFARSIRDQRG